MFIPLVLERLFGVLSARLYIMQLLNRLVTLTNYAVVLNLVLRVPFTLYLICFCNMVLLLVGVCYLWMHLMLLIASTMLHCCGMCVYSNATWFWPHCSRFVFSTYQGWAHSLNSFLKALILVMLLTKPNVV